MHTPEVHETLEGDGYVVTCPCNYRSGPWDTWDVAAAVAENHAATAPVGAALAAAERNLRDVLAL